MIVVGGGNAALSAALSAREHGVRVAVLERAAEEERGGNSAFTAGTMRAVYSGVDDIKALVPDLSPAEIEETDFSSYTTDQFFDDMARVTRYRTNPDLCEVLVTRSNEALHWMRSNGRALHPRLCCASRSRWAASGNSGVASPSARSARASDSWILSMRPRAAQASMSTTKPKRAAASRPIERVRGVRVRYRRQNHAICAPAAIVLACGGFQANAEWRTRYLGAGLGPR